MESGEREREDTFREILERDVDGVLSRTIGVIHYVT